VLYGYGLNCDYETAYALNRAGAEAVRVHTTDLLEHPGLLWDYHLLAVPGGFSWGDDHGAGVILALRLKLALGSALQEFIQAGRLVIGICNGFQVLVNLGVLPGLPGRAEFDELRRLAHSMAGAAPSFGLPEVGADDVEAIVAAAVERGVDLVAIGPEAALVAGAVVLLAAVFVSSVMARLADPGPLLPTHALLQANDAAAPPAASRKAASGRPRRRASATSPSAAAAGIILTCSQGSAAAASAARTAPHGPGPPSRSRSAPPSASAEGASV